MDPSAEIIERPMATTVTSVPARLIEWYRSQGRRLSWQTYQNEHIHRCFGQGITPVLMVDLEKADPDLARHVRSSMFIDEHGYIQSFDAILMHQSEALHAENEAAFNQRRAAMENAGQFAETLEEEFQRAVRATGKASGRPVLINRIPDVRDCVDVNVKA